MPPVLGGGLAPMHHATLGDAGGLTQFGASSGALAARQPLVQFRHWHETEDEFVYILSGEVILIETTARRPSPGDAAAGPPATRRHRLKTGPTMRRYLIVGTRCGRTWSTIPTMTAIMAIDRETSRHHRRPGQPGGPADGRDALQDLARPDECATLRGDWHGYAPDSLPFRLMTETAT